MLTQTSQFFRKSPSSTIQIEKPLTNSIIQNSAHLHFLNPPFQPIHSQAKNESPSTLSHISQVTPTYSPFMIESSNNSSPDDTQISYELNNQITLQQQLQHPQNLTIHQLLSTITSSNPPTPTPSPLQITRLLEHNPQHQLNHYPVLTVLTELLKEIFPITHFSPNPE